MPLLQFTPAAFLDLLERERRWCELLLTAMSIRAELYTDGAQSSANDLVVAALTHRARALRN